VAPAGERPAGAPEATAPERIPIPISIVPLHTVVPGRARLQIGGLRGAPELAALLERGLTGFGGVHEVSASALTGNITLRYEPTAAREPLIERIRGLLRGEIAPARDEPGEGDWHASDAQAVASELGTSPSDGWSAARAGEELARVGANTIPMPHQRSDLSILLGQFQSLPVALLAGVAVVSLATGTLLEAGAILAVVALNAAIGFTTETRAERTIRSLGAPASQTARAVRDGTEMDVAAETLVPGDIIVLQRGTVIAADARLISARALTVSEAALTGESLPVTKSTQALGTRSVPLGDRVNMVYRGTIVTGGSGRAVVVATGARTELGRIQRLVGATLAPETPLQRQLGELGEQLVWVTLAASGAVLGLGLLRGFALLQLVRSSLSVAVAAVPEGLPMVATTTLALGVEDLRRHDILVRRLEAVETLAAVDVVCFDKTGTLTHGSMSLEAVAVGDRIGRRNGDALVDQRERSLDPRDDRRFGILLSVVSLCSECEIEEGDQQTRRHRLSGSATESALVQAALDHGIDVTELRRKSPRRAVQHRSETYRFMATTHATETGLWIAVKGSPGEVLARCAWEALPDGGRRVLGSERRRAIEAQNAAMAARGLRVLGTAYRDAPGAIDHGGEHASDIDRLVWTGLLGLADPVRQGLPALMQKLHRAGIQTIMLTGDQSATARAVAEQIGLRADGAVEIIDASDVDRLTAAELPVAARRACAFARVSPAQKLRIVRALQQAGAVVAMIGDGINDSPALRAADVGMAIGQQGDAAAREVADVFFAGEDLQKLPLAIERGRGTYTNVRKAIHYILSTNTSEVLLMLAGMAAGFGEMLSPIQLLWINLISDVLPAIGLAMEPPQPDALERGPTQANEPMVRRDQMGRLGTEAAMLTASAFGAGLFGAARYGFSSPQARTMAFGSLASAQLLHALTYRSSDRSVLEPGGLSGSPRLVGIVGGSLVAQLAAMLVPGVRNALGVAPIGLLDAVAVAAGGIAPFLISETARAETLAPASLQGLHFRRAAPVGAGFKPAPSDDSRRYAPSAVSVGAGFKPAPTEDKLQTGEACLAPMADQGTPAPPAPPESSAAEAVAVVQPAGSPRRSGPRQRRRMPTR
jgi:Ca2+-transporting ATPase